MCFNPFVKSFFMLKLGMSSVFSMDFLSMLMVYPKTNMLVISDIIAKMSVYVSTIGYSMSTPKYLVSSPVNIIIFPIMNSIVSIAHCFIL